MIAEVLETPIDRLESLALTNEVAELLPHNIFSDKIYVRAVSMKAATPLHIGHKHKTRHLNVIMTGKALVSINGEVQLMEAPDVFESQIGVRKSLYILEDMIWLTVHYNNGAEEYSQEMEDKFIKKTEDFKQYEQERDALLNAMKGTS